MIVDFRVVNSGGIVLLCAVLTAMGCARSTPVSPENSTGPESPTTLIGSSIAEDSAVQAKSGQSKAVCCEKGADFAVEPELPKPAIQQITGGIVVPDVALVNQDGKRVRFHSDIVQGKIVAINFIFTTCKGICPPMSANFAQLQKRIGDRFGDDVALISVSVDPTVDTPERLHAWRQTFGGGPDWTLLTGDKQNVEQLLKQMKVFTADKNNHTPFILLGDDSAGKWIRVHGLTAPEKLAEVISDLHSAAHAVDENVSAEPASIAAERATESGSQQTPAGRAEPAEASAAGKYFTDVELVNQHGRTMRLHSDLLKGKIVVINSFFSTCKGSCPVMLSSFVKFQKRFADRLGKDLYLISITVDPKNDTPEKLGDYAKQWHAEEGWYFLTGDKSNVETALHKLGLTAETKENHSNVFIIGNEATGLWKKARGLSKAEEIFPLLEEVLNDIHP